MKRTYDIDATVATTLADVRSQCIDRSQPISLADAALLVIDMQRFFLDASSHAHVPASTQIIDRVNALIDGFACHHRPVIFTQHINDDANAGQMARWWRDIVRSGDPFCDIEPRIDRRGEVVVKSQYDAFYGTELANRLTSENARHVVICGVVAELCCETTARSAFVHNLSVTLAADAMASWSPENHRATLINAAVGFAWPMRVAEILSSMESADA